MRFNYKKKFVFVSTPKAGTHTICKLLDDYFSEGLRKKGFHDTQIPKLIQNWFRWTCVRNPYSRAVSLWWSACRCHSPDRYGFIRGCGSQTNFNTFIEWLANTSWEERKKEPLLMNQTEWLWPVQPIHVVHLENLNEELKELYFWNNEITIPKLNTSTEKIQRQSEEEGHKIKRPSWQELCSDSEVQDDIMLWAKDDFDNFGYDRAIP